ncbi:MAG: hypothetical protein HQ564_02895 [Candidatus Saganbacteria bacterium]|nr:hypothetical protein [Candidatus Saganbacteria bacterium]
MESLDEELESLDEENIWTLTSFLENLEKEKEVSLQLREAFDFGRMAMRVANELKEETSLRNTIHALVNSALVVATNIYRIHLLKDRKSIDTSNANTIKQEALSELGYCQKLLEYLDSMADDFSLIKKMREQAAYLIKEVG